MEPYLFSLILILLAMAGLGLGVLCGRGPLQGCGASASCRRSCEGCSAGATAEEEA